MIEQKYDGSLKVTELGDDFRQKLIAAVEDETNKSISVVKIEDLEKKLEELNANPPTPSVKPTIWANRQAGYIVEGNVATFIKSKTQYNIDSNGVWRRISKKRHEK